MNLGKTVPSKMAYPKCFNQKVRQKSTNNLSNSANIRQQRLFSSDRFKCVAEHFYAIRYELFNFLNITLSSRHHLILTPYKSHMV